MFFFCFNLQCKGSRSYREANNLKSIYQHEYIAQEKINKKVKTSWGQFDYPPFPFLLSPLGLVPRKDFWLIHHLSYPKFNSINHFIDSKACSVYYASIDDAEGIVASLGPKTLLAKPDIKSAFCLLPVACTDFKLFNDRYYVDKMMPFGTSISCAT